jgi:hypothetical protein
LKVGKVLVHERPFEEEHALATHVAERALDFQAFEVHTGIVGSVEWSAQMV